MGSQQPRVSERLQAKAQEGRAAVVPRSGNSDAADQDGGRAGVAALEVWMASAGPGADKGTRLIAETILHQVWAAARQEAHAAQAAAEA